MGVTAHQASETMRETAGELRAATKQLKGTTGKVRPLGSPIVLL